MLRNRATRYNQQKWGGGKVKLHFSGVLTALHVTWKRAWWCIPADKLYIAELRVLFASRGTLKTQSWACQFGNPQWKKFLRSQPPGFVGMTYLHLHLYPHMTNLTDWCSFPYLANFMAAVVELALSKSVASCSMIYIFHSKVRWSTIPPQTPRTRKLCQSTSRPS